MAVNLIEHVQQTVHAEAATDLLVNNSKFLFSLLSISLATGILLRKRKFKQKLIQWLYKLKFNKKGKERKFRLGTFLLSLFIIALALVLAIAIGGGWGIALGVVVIPIGILVLMSSFSKK